MSEYVERKEVRMALYEADAVTIKGLMVIDRLPAADVVPVVRCKDCLYGSENGFICGHANGLRYSFPNSFCSNGTRRENG